MWQLPPLNPEEILIYLRKSRTDDPTLTVEETLAKHEEMLDDWVASNLPEQGTVPEANRYREVVSGETIDARPRFLELLRRIESPKVKAILNMFPGNSGAVLYFADTKQRRGTRCLLAESMLKELKNVLGQENVVLK